MPNLVLIGAAVWRVLMKQKCDGRTESRTESRTEGRRAFHSPPFFNAGDKKAANMNALKHVMSHLTQEDRQPQRAFIWL